MGEELARTNVEWVGASLALIQRGGDVPVPVGVLHSLMSYALAGPSNEASRANRDLAIEGAHAAIVSELHRALSTTQSMEAQS